MYKRILIYFVILFFSISLKAQEKLTLNEVDKKTYSLWITGKWNELIDECNKSIDNGVDFFYLRLRAGIAYYRKQNYLSAIKHFEKALVYNPSDALTMEYLYYCYLFSGRESDMLALVSVMPIKLKKELRVSNKFIYGVYTEGGYVFNSNYSNQKGKNSNTGNDIYYDQKIINDETYFNISLKHQLGKNLEIFHGYNNVLVSGVKRIYEQKQGQKDYDIKSTQHEYYMNANFNSGKGFNLTAALHYLRVTDEDVTINYDETIPVIEKTQTRANDFVALLSITKYVGHFKFGIKNSFSNLNKATQFQNTAEIIFFPLGNLNLYSVTDATFFSNKEWGSEMKHFGIVDQRIGFKTFDFLWLEAGYTFGDIYNYNENDAFIVLNNTEKISNRVSLNLILPLSRHFEISLRYQYFKQENIANNYLKIKNKSINITNNINHKLIGGLKWTF